MTTSYSNVLKIEFSTMRPDEFNADIRSLDTLADGKRLILGTAISEIFELYTTDVKVTSNSRFDKEPINKGAFAMNSVDKYEMLGLAVFKNQENAGKFLTCSDDGYLRTWAVSDREKKLDGFVELHANSKGIPDPHSDDARLTCVAITPREDFAAVGCRSGAIRVDISAKHRSSTLKTRSRF
jgi:WD40 repeat protein